MKRQDTRKKKVTEKREFDWEDAPRILDLVYALDTLYRTCVEIV